MISIELLKYFIAFLKLPLSKFSIPRILKLFELLGSISIDFFIQYIIGHNLIGLKPHHCDSNFENCQRYSGFFGSELVLGGYFSTIIFSSFTISEFVPASIQGEEADKL